MDIRDLVADEEAFDPLDEEDERAEEEQVEDEQPLIGEPLEERGEDEAADERPADVRIRELLDQMPGQRRLLLKLIAFCREAKTGEEMDAYTKKLQEYCYSVYSPVILRELLENAGAIVYLPDDEGEAEGAAEGASSVSAEGEPAAADAAAAAVGDASVDPAEADVLRETYDDGEEQVEIEYREIEERAPGAWLASDEGLAIVDEQDDLKQARDLMAREPRYLSIYRRLIDYCTEDGGRSIKELDNLVNDDPLLEQPRRYSGYFVARMEKAGVIEWRDGWCATDVGATVLQELVAQAAQAVAQAS